MAGYWDFMRPELDEGLPPPALAHTSRKRRAQGEHLSRMREKRSRRARSARLDHNVETMVEFVESLNVHSVLRAGVEIVVDKPSSKKGTGSPDWQRAGGRLVAVESTNASALGSGLTWRSDLIVRSKGSQENTMRVRQW